MVKSRSVILDCDPGIDDALAILLAVASPELEVEAITTVSGNVGLDQTTQNALKVLELCKVKVPPPVFMGSPFPMGQEELIDHKGQSFDEILIGSPSSHRLVHGRDGLADNDLPLPKMKPGAMGGVDLIISKCLSRPGQLTLISLGPLTNVARALAQAPMIAQELELIVVGGALYISGDIEGSAEFNFRSDPEACEAVLESGVPITLVSLDATRKVILTHGHLAGLRAYRNRLAEFIVSICDYSIDFHRRSRGVDGTYLNDPLGVGIAIDESLGEFEELCIEVDLKRFRGRTNVLRGPTNVRFLREVDTERFLELFLDRLEKLCKMGER